MPELRYHHICVPTNVPRPDEGYMPKYKAYASGYFLSPYGIEWMRFEPDCPLPELVKKIPHIGFVVDDLEATLADKEVVEPSSPTEGVTTATIVHNDAPIEFLQFDGPESEV